MPSFSREVLAGWGRQTMEFLLKRRPADLGPKQWERLEQNFRDCDEEIRRVEARLKSLRHDRRRLKAKLKRRPHDD